jgi:hypothetical protein
MANIELVKMVRSKETAGDGPTEADVHPEEVSNFALGGWVRAVDAPADIKTKK